jgi:hypothetical protein
MAAKSKGNGNYHYVGNQNKRKRGSFHKVVD